MFIIIVEEYLLWELYSTNFFLARTRDDTIPLWYQYFYSILTWYYLKIIIFISGVYNIHNKINRNSNKNWYYLLLISHKKNSIKKSPVVLHFGLVNYTKLSLGYLQKYQNDSKIFLFNVLK